MCFTYVYTLIFLLVENLYLIFILSAYKTSVTLPKDVYLLKQPSAKQLGGTGRALRGVLNMLFFFFEVRTASNKLHCLHDICGFQMRHNTGLGSFK